MKRILVMLLLSFFWPQFASASGQNIGTLSHIHNVKIFGKQIFLGTHEGLYELKSLNTVALIGSDKFDVMGLSIDGRRIYASGHPGTASKFSEPVGLLFSNNSGKSWKQVALKGKVDFHLLESSGSELYGADSQSGNLFYSSNSGKTWTSRGKNTFNEIAINPSKKGSALGIRNEKLFVTKDSFKSVSELKLDKSLTNLEWNKKSLFATSGKILLSSNDQGRTWKTLYAFESPIGTLAQSPELLVATTGNVIWKSNNSGLSFQKLS